MNELTKELQEIPVPRAVLVAYKYEDGPYGKRQKYHLELRPVNRDGKMGAAVPVSHEFMNTLVENYSVEMNGMPYGQIPPGLLWCDTRRGHEKYVWYNPPGRRRMYFTKGLNIENGEFNLPGIIYVVERGGLNVFAFKGRDPVWMTGYARRPISMSMPQAAAYVWGTPRCRYRKPPRSTGGWNTGRNVSG